MQLRAVLFDHDGTLVNSEPIHYRMWAQVLRRYGPTSLIAIFLRSFQEMTSEQVSLHLTAIY
jgi:beta-phosphoglucomutase-like phosphatase (HAD superfamily)